MLYHFFKIVLLISTLLLCPEWLRAQCNVSCRNDLNVSLDANGQAWISPGDILSNQTCDPNQFTIILRDAQNNIVANPITCAQVGKTIKAWAVQNGSGNACWTNLHIQDYLPPQLICRDTVVWCTAPTTASTLPAPTVSDNCTAANQIQLTHQDQWEDFGCQFQRVGADTVIARVTRTWRATDARGNFSICVQRIWLKRATVWNVVFPAHLDGINNAALSCGQDPKNLTLTGRPQVGGRDLSVGDQCDLAMTYTDQEFGLCGTASYRVVRTFTVVDWCTNAIRNFSQVIKVEDKLPPVITCPANITVGTHLWDCEATVQLPSQVVTSDNCSSVTVNPIWDYGQGFGPFEGVDPGVYGVLYRAIDACGNVGTCTMQVTVVDDVSPVTVCDNNTVVQLNGNMTIVPAQVFDDGSFDNCALGGFSVSRDNVIFTPQLTVTCADVRLAPHMVYLKVTDGAGNTNVCQVEMEVRENIPPQITCPPNITLQCTDDLKNLTLTGQPTVADNCMVDTLFYRDAAQLNACRVGWVDRTWTVKDKLGLTRTCTQRITVTDNTVLDVFFPADYTTTQCGADTSAAVTGRPTWTGQGCKLVAATYTDVVFPISGRACWKILRTWQVVNWCVYVPGQTQGLYTKVQTIEIKDITPPVITCPGNVTINLTADNCTAGAPAVIPAATATDCSTQLTFWHNSTFAAQSGANASGTYPMGTTQVRFSVTDGCGNTASCLTRITVIDAKPPVAKCHAALAVSVPASGSIELLPNWINLGSSDNCTAIPDLKYQVIPASVTCADLGQKPALLIVTDAQGNTAQCVTQVSVQNNEGGCPVADVGGILRLGGTRPLPGTKIYVQGLKKDSVITGTDGRFLLQYLPQGGPYTFTPSRNTAYDNGVTALDLVLISKDILGILPFDSPYKIIAADVNNNKKVTGTDIVEIRRMILKLTNKFNLVNSWRFIDASHTFSNPRNPWATTLPESITVPTLNGNLANLNFVAIKMGDVNFSADPNRLQSEADSRSNEAVQWWAEDQEVTAGATVAVPFYAETGEQIEAFQWGLTWKPEALELTGWSSDAPGSDALFTEGSFRILAGGVAGGVAVKPRTPLYWLYFRANQHGFLSEWIHKEEGFPSEWVRTVEEVHPIRLIWKASAKADAVEDMQCYWINAQQLKIQHQFYATTVKLSVLDLSGKTVYESLLDTEHTDLEITIPDSPPGMYVVVLETADKRLQKKLIKPW